MAGVLVGGSVGALEELVRCSQRVRPTAPFEAHQVRDGPGRGQQSDGQPHADDAERGPHQVATAIGAKAAR